MSASRDTSAMIFSNATSVAAPTRGDCNRRLTVPCETAAKIDYDTHARANEHLLERRDSFDTRRRRVHSFAKPPAQDHQTETLDDEEQRQWALDGSTKHLQERQCCGENSGPRKKRQRLLHNQPLRRLDLALDHSTLEPTTRLDSKSITTSDEALIAMTNCVVGSSISLPLSMPTFWDMRSTVAT